MSRNINTVFCEKNRMLFWNINGYTFANFSSALALSVPYGSTQIMTVKNLFMLQLLFNFQQSAKIILARILNVATPNRKLGINTFEHIILKITHTFFYTYNLIEGSDVYEALLDDPSTFQKILSLRIFRRFFHQESSQQQITFLHLHQFYLQRFHYRTYKFYLFLICINLQQFIYDFNNIYFQRQQSYKQLEYSLYITNRNHIRLIKGNLDNPLQTLDLEYFYYYSLKNIFNCNEFKFQTKKCISNLLCFQSILQIYLSPLYQNLHLAGFRIDNLIN
ncbi:unnamed protein product [Paramecium octaurelia]|uniref:Uncharacterized protein n=1 Tax=Paramecium octaurelia TaxID=43137 RepID=A0A8S1WAL5_PAROT|nr:unnamed protein product [Paramecium octaurelia]